MEIIIIEDLAESITINEIIIVMMMVIITTLKLIFFNIYCMSGTMISTSHSLCNLFPTTLYGRKQFSQGNGVGLWWNLDLNSGLLDSRTQERSQRMGH